MPCFPGAFLRTMHAAWEYCRAQGSKKLACATGTACITAARPLTCVCLQVTVASVHSGCMLCEAEPKLPDQLAAESARVHFNALWQVRSPHTFPHPRSHACWALFPHAPVPLMPCCRPNVRRRCSVGSAQRTARTQLQRR
jgi:hypothetical protein